MRDHGHPRLETSLHDAASKGGVVERAETDLDGGERYMDERFVELRAAHVRDADMADEPVVDEPGERTQGRPPGRARVGRMNEVQVDRQPVERLEARLAVGTDRPRPAVRHPRSLRTGHAALGHHPRADLRPARAKPASEEPLVVPELGLAPPVRVRRIEDRDAFPCGGRDRRERAILVTPLVRREAHAAETDAELRPSQPSKAIQEMEGTQVGPGRQAARAVAPSVFDAPVPPMTLQRVETIRDGPPTSRTS